MLIQYFFTSCKFLCSCTLVFKSMDVKWSWSIGETTLAPSILCFCFALCLPDLGQVSQPWEITTNYFGDFENSDSSTFMWQFDWSSFITVTVCIFSCNSEIQSICQCLMEAAWCHLVHQICMVSSFLMKTKNFA